jgi:acyl-CoA thioesterase-1
MAAFSGKSSPKSLPLRGEVDKIASAAPRFFDLPTGGRLFKAFVFLALIFGTPAAAAPIKILALGTSLTQGYGVPPGFDFTVVLESRLKASGIDAKVINAGVSGDTSAGGLARLDWSLADHPDAAIVELGSNDALRGQSPAQTEANIAAVLTKLKAAHVPVLLTGMMAPRNLGTEYAAQFDPIYPRLAKTFGVLFYPFILDGVAMNPKLNQADGIHPNPAGVKIIVERILPAVKKLAAQVKR